MPAIATQIIGNPTDLQQLVTINNIENTKAPRLYHHPFVKIIHI